MTKHFIVTFLLLISVNSFGQSTICNCCTYASLQYKENFDKIFNPETVKKNNIKELTIYTTSKQSSKNIKDTVFKLVDKERREMILKFNNNGFVTSQVIFNHLGKYNHAYDFTRDDNNKILTKTFHYLDSLGKKENILADKWVYTYLNGQLQKIKKLDEKQTLQPDDKSDYDNYEHDKKGRIITETRQLYFDDIESSYYKTKIKYNDTENSSIAITRDKKSLFSTVKNIYNAKQNLLSEKIYDGRNNKLIEEKTLTYNLNGQLSKFKVNSFGMGTECPDGGTYTDTYSYSSLNLIDKILHRYKNTICELRFAYE